MAEKDRESLKTVIASLQAATGIARSQWDALQALNAAKASNL
jgi:hypothetical protein